MTKEQEAIERLKSIDETVEEYDENILKADIETVLNMPKEKDKEIEKKDKIIDLMAEQLAGLTIWDSEKNETVILTTKKEVKQYFERKGKNEN